jgi:hypothetical protein
MSILNKIRSFEFDKNKNKIFGIKSAIIWGHSNKTNSIFPILYIRKPKGITQEEYDELLDAIDINFIIKSK